MGRCFLIAAVALAGCSKGDRTTAERSPPVATATVAAAPAAPQPLTITQRLFAQTQLWAAISVIKPALEDGGLTPGAKALTLWSAERATWEELSAIPETKLALVMKDSEAERGKRICARGSIVEISVDRSAGSAVYFGGLITPGMSVIRFAAVKSTGELVQHSNARFCGIVTGKESYENSGGGVTHAVFAVGMFDLPENRAPVPAKTAAPRRLSQVDEASAQEEESKLEKAMRRAQLNANRPPNSAPLDPEVAEALAPNEATGD